MITTVNGQVLLAGSQSADVVAGGIERFLSGRNLTPLRLQAFRITWTGGCTAWLGNRGDVWPALVRAGQHGMTVLFQEDKRWLRSRFDFSVTGTTLEVRALARVLDELTAES